MITFTREDYEMAAKAAGLRIKWIGDVAHDCTKLKPDAPAFKGPMWNPPEDDGDALRLAANRNISIEWFDTIAGDYVEAQVHWGNFEPVRESLIGRQDNEAVRCAIFRAAIAIGRAMP